MMKRRFTTILAGVLAGNTAFCNSGDCNTGNAAYNAGN